MGNIVWLIIMIPVSLFFTGIGIFAWKRKKPVHFWSGSEVKEEEISDVSAYNKANGIMWLVFSAVFWLSTFLGMFGMKIAGIVLGIGCIAGIPLLVAAYQKI